MHPRSHTARPHHSRVGVVDLSESLPDPRQMLRLRQLVVSRLLAPDYQPPLLPRVAVDLLELSRNPDTLPGKTLQVLASCPMTSMEVLRRARSPAYASRNPPKSLPQAVQRLGARGIAELALEISLNAKIFRSRTFGRPMEATRRHHVGVAHAARVIAQRTGAPAGAAFLAGLVHDVGVAACLLLLEQEVRDGREVALPDALPAIDEVSHEVTLLMVRRWGLPGAILAILDPTASQNPVIGKVRATITLGHMAVLELQTHHPVLPGQEERDGVAVERALRTLGLHGGDHDGLLERAARRAQEAMA